MPQPTTNYAQIPSAFSGADDPRYVPMLFQVVSPDLTTLLLPEFLYLHVNPSSLDLGYSKVITRIQTLGGFVEQHFGDQLTTVSASMVTGGFISVERGLTTFDRRNTIAYRKFQQLLSVFKSNGSVYDDRGVVQFNGRIRIVFGGGTYDGYFTNFEVSESAEKPFMFDLSFSFKATKEARSLLF
jgi:hypothetical protein